MAQLPRQKGNRGFILVLVLALLVLITVLVVGFLGHATSQIKSITSYRSQTSTLVLSDVAVNMVKAQIDTAIVATGTEIASSASTDGLWASQPGAIRVVSPTGTEAMYKLYSAETLTDAKTGTALKADLLADDLPTTSDPADWSSSPVWTDLNAPALKADGTNAYPIIDVVNDPADLPAGGTSADTNGFATGSFNIDSIPTNNPIGATRVVVPGSTAPLPMPVRWLYVLKQGQVIAPDSTSSGNQVTFKNASTQPVSTPGDAATDNPIVGRIAYWTDDDTCRVNINTASYGTFWDTPRFTSADDVNLAMYQPVNKEYQRYPGHSAMTTLSLALPEFAPGGTGTTAGIATLGAGGTAESLIGLTPRYMPGGSEEGTVPSNASSTALTAKANRLYASVDELLFDPPTASSGVRTPSAYLNKNQVETAKFFLTAHSRAPELNLFGEPRVAIWPISSLVNTAAASYQTASDKLIAFCATTPADTSGSAAAAANPFYFVRYPHTTNLVSGAYVAGLLGSNSSTGDVSITRNTQLLSYLDSLTALPLPGDLSGTSSFDTKYALVRGGGGSLGMRQILTEIFDYIRITNSKDPLLDPVTGSAFAPSNSVAANVPYSAANLSTLNDADGQILPTYYQPWGTYGYGRFSGPVVEVSLVFVGVGKGIPAGTTVYTASNYKAVPAAQAATCGYTGVPLTQVPAPPASDIPYPGTTAVQAMFVVNTFDPALGFSQESPDFTVSISGSGLSTLKLTALPLATSTAGVQTSMVFPSATYSHLFSGAERYDGRPQNAGSLLPFCDMLASTQFKASSSGTASYPFFSTILNVPNSGTTPVMSLSGGGPITISIYPLNTTSATSTPIYTYSIDTSKLDSTKLAVPGVSVRPLFGSIRTVPNANSVSSSSDRFDAWSTSNGTLYDSNGENINNIIDAVNDTVISMVPVALYGDYRMLAANASALSSQTLPSTAFQAHPNLSSTAYTQLAYGLEYPGGQVGEGAKQGTLVSVSPAYYAGTPTGPSGHSTANPGVSSAIPLVPATVMNPSAGGTGAAIPPDFDNGFGPIPDGPYINKPDEGIIYNSSAPSNRPYYDNINVGNGFSYASFASPQRQVPSPVMFGSLPTGAPVGSLGPEPWQTLLFQPGATGHAGLNPPKDEYLLDLFWMPQAEPYAISEPFSTAGKVNLNYQILPFTYIDRSTAIQSVLSSEKVAMVSSSDAGTTNGYKYQSDSTGSNSIEGGPPRLALNLSEVDGTLRQFVEKFNSMDFFKNDGEICDVYLVPLGQSWLSDASAETAFYGPNFALVGDNTREKPYADIYPRITTKSNSYTVYYRVQALKNIPGAANAAQWTEGQGTILGDYRGSTTLERYIDPNDNTVPDYATASTGTNLDAHYKWRVVENDRFAP